MHLVRPAAVLGGAFAALLIGAGPASAHFCYFTDSTDQAAAGRGGSSGFMSFHDLAAFHTGLCDAGITVLADAAGISEDTLINAHGTMAGGSGGNQRINHLDFGAIEAAMGDAIAACP